MTSNVVATKALNVGAKCAEASFRILEMLPVPLIALDSDNRVLFANQRARQFICIGCDVAAGTALSEFVQIAEDIEDLKRQSLTAPVVGPFARTTTMFRKSDGREFEVELALQHSRNSDGDEIWLLSLVDVTQFKIKERELARMALTDELTGSHNRRSFMQTFAYEIERAKRYHKPLSLMLIDLDHFKRINDEHGHHVGDLVLQRFADVARRTLRESDVFGRIGGEEFAVLMPETDLRSAKRVADRLRRNASKATVEIDNAAINYTISIGLVASNHGKHKLDDLMRNADAALYAAKASGRDQVKAGFYPVMQQQALPFEQKAAC